jgi:hypothetical protein
MPTGGDPFRRDAAIDNAKECKERWGCPKRTERPLELPPDLAAEARHVATVTGTPEAAGCPLECITYADPWVVEITKAVALAADLHIPVAEQLGRDLTTADLQALSALKSSQGAAWKSDEKIREQKRDQERRNARRGAP